MAQQQPAPPTFGPSESENGTVEKQPSSLVATDNGLRKQGMSRMGVDPNNGAYKDPCYLGQHQVSLGWDEMDLECCQLEGFFLPQIGTSAKLGREAFHYLIRKGTNYPISPCTAAIFIVSYQ